jgi:glycosyltransferase involved in cell wall biosynthesis
MISKPTFTVVLPTRERADVLVRALATVTAQDYDALEILISDNCSQDATREVATSTGDPRVRYVNTGQRLSMAGNCEFALSHVTTDWVALLGDDDGLVPNALHEVAELVTAAEVHALRSMQAQFYWPSFLGETYGRLELPMGKGVEERAGNVWLRRVMAGVASYMDLPTLYTGGFVSLALVERIRREGRVFHSCIPDVYSAVAFGSVIDRYLYSYEPFVVNGASKHSTGAAYLRPEASPEAAPINAFRAEESIPLHPAIPYTSSGGYPQSIHALVYDCYLRSAPLRPDEPVQHQEQLEVVLAMIDDNAHAITAWAHAFAAQHGLDFERAQERAGRRRDLVRLRRVPQRLRAGVTHIVDASMVPIRDIYEASLVAGSVYRAAPSLGERATGTVRSIRGFVQRQVMRLRG